MTTRILGIICALVSFLPAPLSAAELLESYVAVLSSRDHFNSNGVRLTQPWQIIRQDRANYHRFGLRDAGDEWDSFFASAGNRAIAEKMLAQGSISPGAARAVVNGEVMVQVNIYGYGDTGTALSVSVF